MSGANRPLLKTLVALSRADAMCGFPLADTLITDPTPAKWPTPLMLAEPCLEACLVAGVNGVKCLQVFVKVPR